MFLAAQVIGTIAEHASATRKPAARKALTKWRTFDMSRAPRSARSASTTSQAANAAAAVAGGKAALKTNPRVLKRRYVISSREPAM